MTDVANSHVRPHSKGFYAGIGLFSLLLGCMFSYGVFVGSGRLGSRLFVAAFAIVSLSGAFQSAERLFRPEVAQRGSDAIDDSMREKLRRDRNVIDAIDRPGLLIGLLLRLIATGPARDFGTDIFIISGFLGLAALFAADFCGENPQRAFHKYR